MGRGAQCTSLGGLAKTEGHATHPPALFTQLLLYVRPTTGSLCAMNSLVLDKVKAQAEGPATLRTAEGPLPGVDPLVPEEA